MLIVHSFRTLILLGISLTGLTGNLVDTAIRSICLDSCVVEFDIGKAILLGSLTWVGKVELSCAFTYLILQQPYNKAKEPQLIPWKKELLCMVTSVSIYWYRLSLDKVDLFLSFFNKLYTFVGKLFLTVISVIAYFAKI